MSKALLVGPEVGGEPGEEVGGEGAGNNWFPKWFGRVPAGDGGHNGWKFWKWSFSGAAPPVPAAGGDDSMSHRVTVGDVSHSDPVPPRNWKQIFLRLLQIFRRLLFLGTIPAGRDDLVQRPLLTKTTTATQERHIYVPFIKLEEAIDKLKQEQMIHPPGDPITQKILGEIIGEDETAASQMCIPLNKLEDAMKKLKEEGETGRVVVIKLVADNARFSVSGFLYGLHDHYIAPSCTTVMAGLLLAKIVKDHFDAF